jgi:tryptophanyl-tRNA synthetase
MSLQDGTKKMSKSDPADNSRINLSDSVDVIAKKLKKARTDTLPMPTHVDELADRPEVNNLIGIYAAFSEMTKDAVVAEFAGQGFGIFKPKLADLAVEKLGPLSARLAEYMADPVELDAILRQGATRAEALAQPILTAVKDVVGFWR